MKSALRKLRLANSLVMFVISLLATNSPAASARADTNFIDPQIVDDNPQAKQLMDVMQKQGVKTDSLLNEQFLFASLLWGSVGMGYLIYARKQREIVPFLGGVGMIVVSCLVGSWFWMSILCLVLVAAIHQMMRQGS